MNQNTSTRLSVLSFVILLFLSLNISLAQDTPEIAPLVPITVENAAQLESWLPQSTEWMTAANDTLPEDLLFTSTGDELIATLTRTGVQVWDTNSWTRGNFIPIEEYIGAIAISPDDQSIAVAVGDYAPGEKLRFYDLATGAVIAAATYPQTVNSLDYHPTEDYVAAGRSGFDLAFYSTQSATMLFRFSEGGIPYSVAFNPDGTLVASGNADTLVRVYHPETGQSAYVLEAGGPVRSLDFSHDGTILATGTGILTFWDAETGTELHASEYLGDDITDMAFSPDDSLLGTVTSGSVAVWEVATGRLLWEQEIVSSYRPHVAFHPDGSMIAVSHSALTLWVVNTGADSDEDGVDDIRDSCPLQAGEVNGCPDSDGDGLIDTSDACPNEAGTANGCPDEDADGVGNADDLCPQEIGSTAANGCPDEDADGVVDSNDLCPAVAGVEQFGGCPDTDADNIADTDDACPLYAGSAENNGCPQTGHTNANANIRTSPSTNGAVVRSIPPSEEFYIIGRNAAGDWLQIVLDADGEAVIAWVFQSLVVTEIDLSTLPVQE
jgi:DNA-binding beta-propeller fold protein YncE